MIETIFKLLPVIGTLLFSGILIDLAYMIPNIFGFPKAAKVLASLVGLFCAVFTLLLVFDDELFFKSDAKEILTTMEVSLADDFDIVNNKSFIGPDILHTFTLNISSGDKKRIIGQIVSASNYQTQTETSKTVRSKEGVPEVIRIKNYDTGTTYCMEHTYRNSKIFRKITVDKKENQLIVEEWF